jgi:hypothetical protein
MMFQIVLARRRDPDRDRWSVECLLLERVLIEGRAYQFPQHG